MTKPIGTMTLTEFAEAQAELTIEIVSLLQDFSSRTGVIIDEIGHKIVGNRKELCLSFTSYCFNNCLKVNLDPTEEDGE